MAMVMCHRERGDMVAQPVKLEGVAIGLRRFMPRHGEHNDQIPAEAGLTQAEIAVLREQGAL